MFEKILGKHLDLITQPSYSLILVLALPSLHGFSPLSLITFPFWEQLMFGGPLAATKTTTGSVTNKLTQSTSVPIE